jgi:hypothetical protein
MSILWPFVKACLDTEDLRQCSQFWTSCRISWITWCQQQPTDQSTDDDRSIRSKYWVVISLLAFHKNNLSVYLIPSWWTNLIEYLSWSKHQEATCIWAFPTNSPLTSVNKGRTQKYWHDHSLESSRRALSNGTISFFDYPIFGEMHFLNFSQKNAVLEESIHHIIYQ